MIGHQPRPDVRRTLGFFLVPDYFILLLEIIRQLDKEGYRCIVFCGTEATRQLLAKGPYREAIADIVSFTPATDRKFTALTTQEQRSVFERAEAWETKLGINFSHFLLGRRDLTNAFALTGTRHPVPRLRRKRVLNQAQIAAYFADDLDNFERVFHEQRVQHIINPSLHLFFLAARMGIGTAMLTAGRHESAYFWARSHLCLNEGLEQAYNALGDGDTGKRKQRSYSNDYIPRRRFFEERSVVSLLPKLKTEAKNAIIRKVTGSKSGYTFGSMAAYRWRELMAKRKMGRPPYLALSELGEGRYFFFPLSTDPEWTLQVQSDSYFSQLWALAEVARDLPAGVTLLVKEHIYGVGRRPKDFYNQIMRFPNVRMLRLSENALDVIARCDAVVSINSTAGYEAAMMGKPAVFLVEHCDCAFLPHVLHCPKGKGLKKALHKIIKFPMCADEMVAAGSRFISAIEASCFSLEDYTYLDRENVNADGVRQAAAALVKQVHAWQRCRNSGPRDGAQGSIAQ